MEYLILLLTKYGYIILFPLAMAEGPFIALIVGFFIYLGYFQFFPAYAILILGDLIPDTVYYYVGLLGNRKKLIEKYGSRYNYIFSNFKLIEKLWYEHGKKTMFLSKLSYGLSIPFLISAGIVKVPYKKFILYALPVTLFQYATIMTIGYLLGHSYRLAEQYVQYTYIVVAVVSVLFIVGYIYISKYAREQIKKIECEEKII